MSTRVVAESISERILLLRGKRILLDSALAELYGVTTKRLNEQVRRNSIAEFPEALELSVAQKQELDRRLAAYERSPDAGVPWAELKQRLLASPGARGPRESLT